MSEKRGLFRQKSLERVSSPEQLNEYIRVTNPSVWVILIAICILLISVLVWSVTGSLPTTLTANGIVIDGQAVVYLSPEDADQVKIGMDVRVGEDEGKITQIDSIPLSESEVRAVVGSDFAAYKMEISEWNTGVHIAGNTAFTQTGVVEVAITVASVNPISFILN